MRITKLINMNLVANNITDRVLIFHYLSRPGKNPNILYQNSDIIHKPKILFNVS